MWDEGVVVWCAFGTTHNPRAKDWPVVPCEKMVMGLRQVNFFERNLGLDVRVVRQDAGRSVSAIGDGDEKAKGGFEVGSLVSWIWSGARTASTF